MSDAEAMTWEARVDYRLDYQFERISTLRSTDLDLYSKIGGAAGRADRHERLAAAMQVQIARLRVAVWVLTFLTVAVGATAAWAVLR